MILQAVDESYLKALKEKYIGYDCILPTTMMYHLRSQISKVTNGDKAAVKRKIFIPWKQPTVLSAYFKKIGTAKKKLKKWNVTISDNNIIIHVVEQMYESNWFTKENMTEWEEKIDRNKSWDTCKLHFKLCYIAHK